eukprot:TRINITY_DN7193_c0_g3_i1.p1 TRINITY_DN7193_c0_g3~~TRINITY_DN7193_c0_g3_i1.p1  ORF type:complete len:240 (+),score=69.48 TRINITY_DN7193_c0_g3_i1:485-1204(+)
MEAGFGSGSQPQPCENGRTGTCSGGLDVPTCEKSLGHQCGSANVKYGLMLDTCGGHAMPYHYHKDLACDYNSGAAGHSPLIGIALDGYGIYGLNEATGTRPSNLDLCNGHTAGTPATSSSGITTPSAVVYHYHVSALAPYTLGCYGPVSTVSACEALYSTCNTGFETVTTAAVPAGYCYDLDCPCYDSNGRNAEDANCGLGSSTLSPTTSSGSTPPPVSAASCSAAGFAAALAAAAALL